MRNLVLAVAALLLAGWIGSKTTLSQETTPTGVGYLDIQRVYQDYRKQQDVQESFRVDQDALEQATRKAKADLERRAEALNELAEGSDEFRQVSRQLAIEGFTLKRDFEAQRDGIREKARRTEEAIYREICLEVKAYAENEGLASVHLWRGLEDALRPKGDLELVIGTRAVLHRDPRLDITDAIIRSLNAALPPR